LTADTPLNVRPAQARDLPAILDLVESAYRGDSSRGGWTTEADLLDGQRTDLAQLRGILTDPDSILLVTDSGMTILGCCHLQHRGSAPAYFGMFAVRPETQGSGLGRRLLEHAEQVAADRWQAAAVEMTVIGQRNDLIAWYERCGYQRTGEQRPFPYGDARFGVPKRDDLYFAVLVKQLTRS
jgi:ribosomal protein S18 acetylase RimI-like enzyme